MSKSLTAWIIAGVVAAGVIVVTTAGVAEEKVKAGESVHIYNDPSYAAENGEVVFSHLQHKELFGQEKLDCKPCHMTKPPLFSMKKKEGEPHQIMKMSDMANGMYCGGCHNGKTSINGKVAPSVTDPDGCGHCHKK